MRKRTLTNGTVIAGVLLVLAGAGVAVASAATSRGNTTVDASASASTEPSATATATATASATATATASPSASSTSDGSECADVFLTTAPADDKVGTLCTAVDSTGTTVSGVTVTFTATSACSGNLMLRVSGADSAGAEFGEVKQVTCSSKKATASFTPASKVASNTFLCGTLLADKYTAAQACVTIS
ncbi:hypothetical protein [Paractinoplanes durhamensis]|uniref:Uncharacterized protein n=1 Tax=Paractinoplanes durhamensis TaxID=113563 RepID=A0ABQ3YP83_9ACTN|nr:hypothetical protein [Actinoplanes durhamensis]GID99318.1 hypothetical protein Adu01nite_06690 [Actinoplanes durhamensis]